MTTRPPTPDPRPSARSYVVLKFGGTSVATAERWRTIRDAAQAVLDEGARPLVVCSALAGVSDRLDAWLGEAASGEHRDAQGWAAGAVAALRERHEALASDLGVDLAAALEPTLDTLARDLYGAALLAEASPRLRARVLATGELLSTTLGAAYLQQALGSVRWHDARALLRTTGAEVSDARRYLAAVCDHASDAALAERFAAARVHVTQGFIAGTPDGETALLGRGGSDVSAALFAAKLGAARLEIWTDVPGLFTADPRRIPGARLLRHLGYAEAQELASTGAKVLHPRTIAPARAAGVPIVIRCTPRPAAESTRISAEAPDAGAGVRALSVKEDVTLVSMETPGMWQEVGFLADVFGAFKRHGLSVDLVSTSETNVTVTLDAVANALGQAGAPQALDALVADLQAYCEARVAGPYTALSLVGRQLRSVLPELGPAFEALDGEPVHLVAQAASDLNLSVVVDPEHAERILRALHASLFGHAEDGPVLGPTYEEVMGQARPAAVVRPWWHARRADLLALAAEGTPRYVYDAGTVRAAARRLTRLAPVGRVLYALKANPHPDLLRVLRDEGLGFECVSPGEVERVRALFPDLDPAEILFTPNFAPREEYAWAFEQGVRVTLDNVYGLEAWPDVFAGRALFVRVDPGEGRGHHKHVRTAGAASKFGVAPAELDRLAARARDIDARVIGLHAHVGSGVGDVTAWAETATRLAEHAARFPDVRVLDLGGGLAVPAWSSAPRFNVEAAAEHLARFRALDDRFELWLEPGRYLVAEAGVLLATVTQTKAKGDARYVGVDAGMHTLLRPALYGAYHEIVNLSRLDAPPAVTAEVVGPICESGDVLGHGRRLPETREGDTLLVATAGAYGQAMASQYNLRAPATETVLDDAVPVGA